MTDADAILVLNAGSSSLKFSLFTAHDAAPSPLVGGQVGGIFTTPVFIAKDPAGQTVGEKRWGAGEAIGHRARWATSSTGCGALWPRPSPGGRRSSRLPRRPRLHDAGPGRRRGRRRAGEAGAVLAAAPAAQPRPDPDAAGTRSGLAADRLLRHGDAPHAAVARADVRAAPGAGRGRRAALRIPRHLVRVHRRSAARRRPARGAREDRRPPPGQRRQHVRARCRTQHRDDDGLHGGGRAADGDALGARSIPACCCT